MDYHFSGEEEISSPALIFYEDVIEENINKAISLAGDAGRLWPHIKTHKTAAIIRMQIERGIERFKCATIAEAELCALCGAPHVLLAYPLVGPAIGRFAKLRSLYADTCFWAIGDDLEQLELLGRAVLSSKNKTPLNTLVDVNVGMNRTGVSPGALEEFFINAGKIEGLALKGFHCYDGHITAKDLEERRKAVSSAMEKFEDVKKSLEKKAYGISVIIMGGTPTFACHRETPGVYLSPGTFFINDYGYGSKFTDLDFTPGAAILSRVISRPGDGLFTLDTGYKAIASDPSERGVISGFPEATPLFQSEEHWVWKTEGKEPPPVGKTLYIIPTHICPTSALYPGAFAVKNGKLVNYWETGARNRKITV